MQFQTDDKIFWLSPLVSIDNSSPRMLNFSLIGHVGSILVVFLVAFGSLVNLSELYGHLVCVPRPGPEPGYKIWTQTRTQTHEPGPQYPDPDP